MIKNFIYLDEYKMYSLSSQIFEGVTEYLVNSSYEDEGEEDTQKGIVGSGRLLANIMKKGNISEEKKFLHDYSYTVFEKHLIENDNVLDINNINHEDLLNIIDSKSFIKITGKVIFNDVGHMSKMIKEFNTMGTAIVRIQSLENPKMTDSEIKKTTQERGLSKNKKALDALGYLLDFGFENQFEIQLPYYSYLFSSNIKREYLREKEELLVKKYARTTEKEFTIFGILTQYKNIENIEDGILDGESDKVLKVALMKMVKAFSNIENTFTGKLENEIMIDPIAIYTEL